MHPKLILTLTLTDSHGGKHGYISRTLPDDVAMFGDRLADDMRAGLAFAGPMAFDNTVKVLKNRKLRRDLLSAASENLGQQLADYLEDSEGWHGTDRQDRIKGRT